MEQSTPHANTISNKRHDGKPSISYGIIYQVWLGQNLFQEQNPLSIVAAQGLAGDGLQITYDILMQTPTGTTLISKATPSQGRYDCLIYPAAVGTPVLVYILGQQIIFTVTEVPANMVCSS